jgi:hypothetical protein
VRARSPNTSPRALVAPCRALALVAGALSAATALAGGLAACGSAEQSSGRTLVDETFASHPPIHSGRFALSFALSPVGPAGPPAIRRPFAARLSGAFQSTDAGLPPRFAIRLEVSPTPRGTLAAGAVSTGGRLFVELAGVPFATPQSSSQALARGYTEAGAGASFAGGRSRSAALGVEPARWLTHPALAGHLAGGETVHIVAGLDGARFFADADRLLAAAGSLLGAIAASGTAGGAPALLTGAGLGALAGSVRSARVDLYSGAADHLLRRLSVSAALSGTGPAGGGAAAASVTLVLTLAALNRVQSIAAPTAPRPFSELLPAAERLGLLARPTRDR